MSELTVLSPLLDGCVLSEAIRCQGGVRCYPVLREATGQRYMLKIISVPHSPSQVAALLLSGTCQNRETAADYFLKAAKNIAREKILLNDLSRYGGFLPYEQIQAVPTEDGIGYHVYLMAPYRLSAERIFAGDACTHLQAMNLALDMCTALAACRRAGQLYVNLKPSNIFYSEQQGFRIGDLGFVALDNIRSTALAERYQSVYSPAEVKDPMAVLNTTVDTYALGMILYEIYNGGQLPEAGAPLPPPAYADYELAEILLKACAQQPEDRWPDPASMGRALVSYIQRNSLADTPIIPAPIQPEEPEEVPEEIEEFLPELAPLPEELATVQEPILRSTTPDHVDVAALEGRPITEETSEILAQADALLAVLAPEYMAEAAAQTPPQPAEEIPAAQPTSKKLPWKSILIGAAVALLLVAAFFAGREFFVSNDLEAAPAAAFYRSI